MYTGHRELPGKLLVTFGTMFLPWCHSVRLLTSEINYLLAARAKGSVWPKRMTVRLVLEVLLAILRSPSNLASSRCCRDGVGKRVGYGSFLFFLLCPKKEMSDRD